MQLTTHFTLSELLVSHAAYYLNLKEQFNPPQEAVDNLKSLCENVLEPIFEMAGRFTIHRAFLCPELNEAFKGSSTSPLLKGEGADISVGSRSANKILYETIKTSNILWDQLIWKYGDEKGPDWLQITYKAKGKNRKQTIRK